MYSSVDDMIQRFGEVELTRMTTPQGQAMEFPDPDRINAKLVDASALVDSYVRRRYAMPITGTVPAEITRAAAILARYDLATGDNRQPNDEMRADRDQVMGWLRDVRDGKALLDLSVVSSSEESHATVATRRPVYGRFGNTTYGGLDE